MKGENAENVQEKKEDWKKNEGVQEEVGRKVPNNQESLQLAKRAEDLAKTVNGRK